MDYPQQKADHVNPDDPKPVAMQCCIRWFRDGISRLRLDAGALGFIVDGNCSRTNAVGRAHFPDKQTSGGVTSIAIFSFFAGK